MDRSSELAATNADGKPTRVWVRRAPLAAAAGALAAGIVAGRYLELPPGVWVVLGSAGLVLAAVTLRRRHLRTLAAAGVTAAIVSIGAIHVHTSYYRIEEDHIVTFTGSAPILATLRGRIITSPMRYRDTTSMGYRRPDRIGFVLRTENILTGQTWRSASGLVRVMIQEPTDHLCAGQKVELVGRIGRFAKPANPGQFDRASAARRKATLVWMTVPCPQGAIVLSGTHRSWAERIYWNLRSASRQHLAGFGDGQDACLLGALIIGERDPSLDQLNRTMARAGVAHFLSISGLHLGVFLGFIYLLCRICMLTPRRSALLVLTVLGVYVLIAEPRAPLLRSALMAAALCLSTIARRRHSAINSISAAAILLLAMDPLRLFSPGFQLSFAIVCGIVLLLRPVRGIIFSRQLRRRGLLVFRADQSMKRWVHYRLGNWLMDGISLALVAYIAAAPLVAYHFALLAPYAVFLSVLLFPLVAMVLIPGYVSMALHWPLPGLSYTVGRLANWSADLLAKSVGALEGLPGLSFQLRPLHPAWVVLCYATVALLIYGRRIPFGRILATGAMVALVAWSVMSQLPEARPDCAQLHVFAVGSGQCCVLRTPSGRTVILDAGTSAGYDAHRQVLEPAIRSLGLPPPPEALISHANTDHFNALGPMVRSGQLRRVYFNDYFATGASTPSWRESAPCKLMASLREEHVEVVRLHEGDSLKLDKQTRIDVLWPPRDKPDHLTVNDTSLVLRISCDDKTVLLTGDLDQHGQEQLAISEAIQADLLMLPHHGGWESSLPAFVDAVNPDAVLVSTRRDPAVGAKKGERAAFFDGLRSRCRYHTTASDGWTCVSFGNGKLSIETMRRRTDAD